MQNGKSTGVRAINLSRRLRRLLAATVLSLVSVSCTAGAVDWGLWYGNGVNQPPNGEESASSLAKHGAFFLSRPSEKVFYLTLDCGYESGYAANVLDILKKHHVPATFFVVGHYIDSAPDIVKRMGDEGHLVGNHSTNHPNMTRVGKQRFDSELVTLENKYTKLTGRKLDPFFRPPEGSYTHENLNWARELGYYTILWSVAYADWDENAQPSPAVALQTVRNRAHNGAIILLHIVSRTNAAILDELITGWKAQGYSFAALSAMPELPNPTVNAIPSASAFTVDGTPVPFTAFRIREENYVKLRDLAACFAGTEKAFSVDYDKAAETVRLTSGTYAPLGSELSGPADAAAFQARKSHQTVLLDGTPVTAYSIAGTNYVSLRGFADALRCTVTYDPVTRAVALATDSPTAPEDAPGME